MLKRIGLDGEKSVPVICDLCRESTMPAFPGVQKPAGKQNTFPKISGARSANLIHTHEILRKQ